MLLLLNSPTTTVPNSIFDAGELAQIRADLEATLPDVGTIYELTKTKTGTGAWSEAWNAVGTCACRLDFIGGREGVNSAALLPYSKAILTLPQSTVITEQHRFAHGFDTYTVQAVNLGSWLGIKRATVEKI